jgi:hypothetical protein
VKPLLVTVNVPMGESGLRVKRGSVRYEVGTSGGKRYPRTKDEQNYGKNRK